MPERRHQPLTWADGSGTFQRGFNVADYLAAGASHGTNWPSLTIR
jgi:hypothetical protein